jgi:hypothetical protein
MNNCKLCGVPLRGFFAFFPRLLFRVRRSKESSTICNKCAQKNKMYRCHICSRMIHEATALEHVKAEEYFISLIRKDHSFWGDKVPTDEECLNHYRELVRKTEI